MIATLVSVGVLIWSAVAIGAAIAIAKAIRLADDATERIAEWASDPDGRPLHVSQMTFVPAEWSVQS